MTERLQGVVIENRDALDVIAQHDRADCLHYVDPPYVHATRKKRQIGNYHFEMTDDQHRELAEALHLVKGMVILSGYPSELYEELYRGWTRIERAAHADGARDRTEVLWLSPNILIQRTLL